MQGNESELTPIPEDETADELRNNGERGGGRGVEEVMQGEGKQRMAPRNERLTR